MTELEQLVTKAAAGDMTAFEGIYKQTYKQVHFTCMAFLKNEQDAADVSQDVYVTAMRSLPTLKDKSAFEGWLGRVTVNKCKNFLKKKKPIPIEQEELYEKVDENAELLLPEDYVVNEAKRKIVMDIMKETLSDTLYQTVVLFYFQSMSANEIARLMECPVSTVTARLCKARAKIKDGVLKYEKENGDKLYSVAFVPVLAAILMAEAQAAEPVYVFSNVIAATQSTMTTAQQAVSASQTGAAGQATVSQMASTAAKVATTGGKTMLNSLKAKIIAGLLALLVVGGGIFAAVTISNNSDDKDNDKKNESVQDDDEDKENNDEGKGSEDVTDTPEPTQGADSGNGEDDTPVVNDPENMDYNAMAEDALEQIDEFFTALTSGDYQTVLEMGYEDDEDFYEDFEEMCEYDCTEQFLQTIYGDVKHCINDETVEDLAYYIESAYRNESEFVHVPMEYSLPLLMIFDRMYYAAYEEGVAVTPSEIVAKTAYNDDAFPVIEMIMAEVPMVKAPDFWIKLPDENGDIKVVLSYVMGDLEMDDLYIIDESYPANFLCDRLLTNSDAIVGAGNASFYENDAELNELDRLLAAKDFAGLEEYLGGLTGEDYSAEYGDSHGHYADLTDSQKAFVDSFVEEEFDYELVDYVATEDNNHNGKRFGLFLLTFPVLNDLENRDIMLTDWYAENDVNEYYFALSGVSSNVEDFDTFLYYYYQVIEYAAEYVE